MAPEETLYTPEEDVAEFIAKFDASRDPALWEKLIEEEMEELRQAILNVIKEMADLAYVIGGYNAVAGDEALDKLAARLDQLPLFRSPVVNAIIDAVEPVMPEAFKRVHLSNMSKLGDDGKPLRREDGKVLKGPNYKPPVLDDLIAS